MKTFREIVSEGVNAVNKNKIAPFLKFITKYIKASSYDSIVKGNNLVIKYDNGYTFLIKSTVQNTGAIIGFNPDGNVNQFYRLPNNMKTMKDFAKIKQFMALFSTSKPITIKSLTQNPGSIVQLEDPKRAASLKYKFTGKRRKFAGRTLYQIVARKTFGHVSEGDIGGWVQTEGNLSHGGTCWVHKDAVIMHDAIVSGDAQVMDNASVMGDAQVLGKAQIYGNARVFGNVKIYDKARVYGHVDIYEHAKIYGNANVCDNAQIHDDAAVYGSASIYGSAKVFGKAQIFGNAVVCDKARVFGNAKVAGNQLVKDDEDVF